MSRAFASQPEAVAATSLVGTTSDQLLIERHVYSYHRPT